MPQHRAGRGMGGRPSLMILANIVWLDSITNGLIEHDSDVADVATTLGIKVSSHTRADDLAGIPIRFWDGWHLPTEPKRTPIRDDEAAELLALHGIRTEEA